MMLIVAATLPDTALAKSVYVIGNINSNPTPVHSYELGAAPDIMTFQAEDTFPSLAGGAVGIAIEETTQTLAITYEVSNTIQLLSAITFDDLGTATAPGANNLAGIVFHQAKARAYAIDRFTNNLYVYDWDSATNTLTLVDGGGDSGNGEFDLLNVSSAFGLALDETQDRLYVADGATNIVRYFETTGFTESGNITLTEHAPISIAVDQTANVLYTGAAFNGNTALVKYDLATDTETSVNVATAIDGSDGAVGVAVDEDTGNVYATTGFADDALVAFDSDLNLLQVFSKAEIQGFGGGTIWGDPTGLAIPRSEITFGEAGEEFFEGKGEAKGGLGSGGPLSLLVLGAIGLAVLFRNRARRHSSLMVALLAVMVLSLSSATVYAQEEDWYVGAGIGGAWTGVDDKDLDDRLTGLGYTTSSDVEDTDAGWKLFGGYQFNENFAIEGTFVDLGKVTSDILVTEWPQPGALDPDLFVADAVTVHPYSVGGFALTGVGTHRFSEKTAIFAKLGVFRWKADILVRCSEGCTDQATATADGTDWSAGAGMSYDFANAMGGRIEWERFATDRDDVDFFSISAFFRF
jgi:OOP family OmpA-OmpF porin